LIAPELPLGPQTNRVQPVVRRKISDETCAVARTYRLSPGRKAVNHVMGALLSLGVPAPQRTSYLMTTRGRKTGRERTTPVNLVEADDGRWLVSPYGDVGWVHNLRANGALQLRRGRARESIVAEEVGPAEAGPILQRYVHQVGITAPFFDARRTDSVENFVAEAGSHPVFRLKSASESA
jgi:deazaflavin-dependent oxidoreductase (nitroreductase family)